MEGQFNESCGRDRPEDPAVVYGKSRHARRLNDESPTVGLRSMRFDRTTRPRDHVVVEITVLAMAATLDVPFAKEESAQ